jgi:hypothetical protein
MVLKKGMIRIFLQGEVLAGTDPDLEVEGAEELVQEVFAVLKGTGQEVFVPGETDLAFEEGAFVDLGKTGLEAFAVLEAAFAVLEAFVQVSLQKEIAAA